VGEDTLTMDTLHMWVGKLIKWTRDCDYKVVAVSNDIVDQTSNLILHPDHNSCHVFELKPQEKL
jgi:hypothetical protein